MFKKIRLINKVLSLVDAFQKLAAQNKETIDEVFKIVGKIKKVSPEIADILEDIKGLL